MRQCTNAIVFPFLYSASCFCRCFFRLLALFAIPLCCISKKNRHTMQCFWASVVMHVYFRSNTALYIHLESLNSNARWRAHCCLRSPSTSRSDEFTCNIEILNCFFFVFIKSMCAFFAFEFRIIAVRSSFHLRLTKEWKEGRAHRLFLQPSQNVVIPSENSKCTINLKFCENGISYELPFRNPTKTKKKKTWIKIDSAASKTWLSSRYFVWKMNDTRWTNNFLGLTFYCWKR